MPRIERLVVQVLCYATEDEEKVMKAVENLVGSEAMEHMALSSSSLTGHYGDPISLIRLTLLEGAVAKQVFRSILERLSPQEKEEIWSERAEKGRHGGKIYLRLDKQAAYLGAARISDKDPIRIQVDIRGGVEAFKKRLESGRDG